MFSKSRAEPTLASQSVPWSEQVLKERFGLRFPTVPVERRWVPAIHRRSLGTTVKAVMEDADWASLFGPIEPRTELACPLFCFLEPTKGQAEATRPLSSWGTIKKWLGLLREERVPAALHVHLGRDPREGDKELSPPLYLGFVLANPAALPHELALIEAALLQVEQLYPVNTRDIYIGLVMKDQDPTAMGAFEECLRDFLRPDSPLGALLHRTRSVCSLEHLVAIELKSAGPVFA